MSNTIIAASILAADWGNFSQEIKAVESAGANWIHCDVMDGHFVPPITFGADVVKAARAVTKLPLDVHLMIENPEKQLQNFIKAGAQNITVHFEACPHLHRIIKTIHDSGLTAGVALNPATPINLLHDIIEHIDLVLIMTVDPGWGGQEFIGSSTRKIEDAAQLIKATGKKIWLEVDGGLNQKTSASALRAGANVIVAGTSIFSSKDYKSAIAALRM